MKTIRIIGNRLHVRQVPPKLLSGGGVHLPGKYQDDASNWHVLGIGDKVRDIMPGDLVLSFNYHGNLVDLGDGTALMDAKEAIAVWAQDF